MSARLGWLMIMVMPDNSELDAGRGSLRKWLSQVEVLAALIALAGIILFVVLRFPYGIYYEGLGTSPEEIKLGYAQMLGQSSALIFTIGFISALVLAVLPLLIIRLWNFAVFYLALLLQAWTVADRIQGRLLRRARRSGAHAPPPQDSTTFVQGFRWLQDPRVMWWNERSPRALARAARIAVLQEKNGRTPREERELRSLKLKHAITEQYGAAWGYAQWIRRSGFWIFLAIASMSLLVGLPLLAAHELSEVSQCRKPVLEIQGIKIPGLAFAGDPVDVVPAGTSVAAVPPGKELFLLGSSDGFHVMYDCKGRAPVRLPVQSYLIITKG